MSSIAILPKIYFSMPLVQGIARQYNMDKKIPRR